MPSDTISINNWDSGKSYAKKETLFAKLVEMGFTGDDKAKPHPNILIVRTGDDAARWTAVFPLHLFSTSPAFKGFKVLG